MKKYAALLLLFYAGFSLYAQTYDDATVFISPVTGTGSSPRDNEYITNQIIAHLEKLDYMPTRSIRNAAFTMYATISEQEGPENRPSSDPVPIYQAKTYVLSLELMDNKTGKIIINQDIFYSEPEEIPNLLVLNFKLVPFAAMYTEIKVGPTYEPSGPEEWRTKSWYLCAGVFWTPRVYEGDYESTYYVNFGYGISAEYHFLKLATEKTQFLNYLALSAGLELVPDWVAVRENESYRDLLLEIPVLINGVLKPADYFFLLPYLGVNFNIALYGDTIPPLAAWRLGFQYGIKAGAGTLVFEPWFSMDFGKSAIASEPDTQYQRYMMHIGVKYKYGFDDFKNFFWYRK